MRKRFFYYCITVNSSSFRELRLFLIYVGFFVFLSLCKCFVSLIIKLWIHWGRRFIYQIADDAKITEGTQSKLELKMESARKFSSVKSIVKHLRNEISSQMGRNKGNQKSWIIFRLQVHFLHKTWFFKDHLVPQRTALKDRTIAE